MILTLEQVKSHLNIDLDYKDDDLYLLDLATVAESSVMVHLNITDYSEITGANDQIPAPVIHAILLLTGNLYMNREPVAVGVSVATIPYTYEYLLSGYRNYKIV